MLSLALITDLMISDGIIEADVCQIHACVYWIHSEALQGSSDPSLQNKDKNRADMDVLIRTHSKLISPTSTYFNSSKDIILVLSVSFLSLSRSRQETIRSGSHIRIELNSTNSISIAHI